MAPASRLPSSAVREPTGRTMSPVTQDTAPFAPTSAVDTMYCLPPSGPSCASTRSPGSLKNSDAASAGTSSRSKSGSMAASRVVRMSSWRARVTPTGHDMAGRRNSSPSNPRRLAMSAYPSWAEGARKAVRSWTSADAPQT